jgi:DNA-binding transcriptional regulator YdaS (Cro superfamily)
MNDHLSRAIELAGGQSALAKAVGVKQQNVWSWVNRTGKCPPEHVLAVEAATEGAVTRYQLRPDIYGPAPSDTAAA